MTETVCPQGGQCFECVQLWFLPRNIANDPQGQLPGQQGPEEEVREGTHVDACSPGDFAKRPYTPPTSGASAMADEQGQG